MQRRHRLTLSILLTPLALSIGGCGPLSISPLTGTEVPTELRIPYLEHLHDTSFLSLSQVAEGLVQYANRHGDLAMAELNRLYNALGLRTPPNALHTIAADLNGDGQPEFITAVNDRTSAVGTGTIFVLYREGDQWRMDQSGETVFGAGLHAVGDLTGDGQPDILWSSTVAGANTPRTTLFLSHWHPGALETSPTDITATYSQVEISDRGLLIHGGLQGGWGAGRVQRERTDRYVWEAASFKLVERRYAPSPYGYHRLVDGILAEEWQEVEVAAQAYAEAMEPTRTVLFTEDETLTPEMVTPNAEAVRTFARFRLALLLIQEGRIAEALSLAQEAQGPYADLLGGLREIGKTGSALERQQLIEQAHTHAEGWVRGHPDFLAALNAPRGWANPQWDVNTLWGKLPTK